MPDNAPDNLIIQESDYLRRIIFNLLTFQDSSITDTVFFQQTKHNDYLVPELDLRIDDILSCFVKYRSITHDCQGFLDHGIDVLLKYAHSEKNPDDIKYIGFQIKSHDDLEKKYWLRDLKAQTFEAFVHAPLLDYYIIVCTDHAKHLSKLRAINTAFGKEKNVHVIKPQFAFSFLNLTPQRIGSYIKVWFSREDRVFLEAQKDMVQLSPHQGSIIIELLISYIFYDKTVWDIDDLENVPFVKNVYRTVPNNFEYRYWRVGELEEITDIDDLHLRNDLTWANDIYLLETFLDECGYYSSKICLKLGSLLAFTAFVLDGYVRYGYKDDDLKEYLLETFFSLKIEWAKKYTTYAE